MAHQLNSKNEIFTERLMSGTWYCPGGTSTIAQLIKDAMVFIRLLKMKGQALFL